jgi:hypothetical protein
LRLIEETEPQPISNLKSEISDAETPSAVEPEEIANQNPEI